MKFIFPQNYKYKNKLLGFIDYQTLFFNLIWDSFILIILNILINNFNTKFFLFIILCFPIFLISIVSNNNENIIYVILYVYKFLVSTKIYLYTKESIYYSDEI